MICCVCGTTFGEPIVQIVQKRVLTGPLNIRVGSQIPRCAEPNAWVTSFSPSVLQIVVQGVYSGGLNVWVPVQVVDRIKAR